MFELTLAEFWIAMLIAGGIGIAIDRALTRRLRKAGAATAADALQVAAECEMLADHVEDGLYIQGTDGQLLWANEAFCELVGRPRAEILGRRPTEIGFAADEPAPAAPVCASHVEASHGQRRIETTTCERADGQRIWCRLSLSKLAFGPDDDRRIMVNCRDITKDFKSRQALAVARRSIKRQMKSDALTALPNRAGLIDELRDRVGSRGIAPADLALLQFDIARFGKINDFFGYICGDHVLQEFAARLRNCCGMNDFVARLDGDQFAVLLAGATDVEALHARATSMRRVLAHPVLWEGRNLAIEVNVGWSMGVVSDEPTELLQRSDIALWHSKQTGCPAVAYSDEIGAARARQARLGRELRDAIEARQLVLYFQPQQCSRLGVVTGAEGLIRWKHPELGWLSPAEFLPIAEQDGLMHRIDAIAIERTLDALCAMRDAGFGDLTFSVNVSNVSLNLDDFAERLNAAVAERGLSPSQVTVEVLETTLLSGRSNAACQTIEALAGFGFHRALDDFGTGHAGLAQLATLNVDIVKVDRSMTMTLPEDETNLIITRAIVDLCRDLGIKATVEGVETDAQLACLDAMGPLMLQGYHIAKPMPLADLKVWLADRQGEVAQERLEAALA